jgi:Transposase IS116/IS110/IS902 family
MYSTATLIRLSSLARGQAFPTLTSNKPFDATSLGPRRGVTFDVPVRFRLGSSSSSCCPITALTTVVVLGPASRFPRSREVTSSVGLAPALHALADMHHLGQITKQGNPVLRLVLVQAAATAARYDQDLRRLYLALVRRRGHAKAKVAVARKLLVRLVIMLRDSIDYEEFRRRGRASRSGEVSAVSA